MRTYTATTVIVAPPECLWPILADVVRWPEWLPTVTSVEALGAEPLAVGARYRIAQPKLRPAIWSVVRIEPYHSFAWESRSPGVRALANHCLSPAPGGSTEVTLRVDFSGPLSALVGAIAGRLTKEYLRREVAALERRDRATS